MERLGRIALSVLVGLLANTATAARCRLDKVAGGEPATIAAPTYRTYSIDEIGLLEQVRANEDRTPALIYADFLDEKGDELSRNQAAAIRLANDLAVNPPKRRALGLLPDRRIAKLAALRQTLEWEQAPEKGKPESPVTVQFHNGVPVGVTMKGNYDHESRKRVDRLVANNPGITQLALSTDNVGGQRTAKRVLVEEAVKGHPGALAQIKAELAEWETALANRKAGDPEPYFRFENTLLEDLADRTARYDRMRAFQGLKGVTAADLQLQYSPSMVSLLQRYRAILVRTGYRPSMLTSSGAKQLAASFNQLTDQLSWKDIIVLASSLGGRNKAQSDALGLELVERMDRLHASGKLTDAYQGKIFPIIVGPRETVDEPTILNLVVEHSKTASLVAQARERIAVLEAAAREKEKKALEYDNDSDDYSDPRYYWW